MHWLTLAALGGLANAGVLLLWKNSAGRTDTMALVACANLLAGALLLAYVTGFAKVRVAPDGTFLTSAAIMACLMAFVTISFSIALRTGPVSYVNPVFGGVLNIAVVLGGVLLFAEKITLLGLGGVAAILAGVIMIAWA